MKKQNTNYIRALKYHKTGGPPIAWKKGYWVAEDRVDIEKIKIVELPQVTHYKLNVKYVDEIVSDFWLEGWEPIRVTEQYYLLDGQHRLAAAKTMGLKYIDVIKCKDEEEIERLEEEVKRNSIFNVDLDFTNLGDLNKEIRRLKKLSYKIDID
jgi:hypothetical protein